MSKAYSKIFKNYPPKNNSPQNHFVTAEAEAAADIDDSIKRKRIRISLTYSSGLLLECSSTRGSNGRTRMCDLNATKYANSHATGPLEPHFGCQGTDMSKGQFTK